MGSHEELEFFGLKEVGTPYELFDEQIQQVRSLLGKLVVLFVLKHNCVIISYHCLLGWHGRDVEGGETSYQDPSKQMELTVSAEDFKLSLVIISLNIE